MLAIESNRCFPNFSLNAFFIIAVPFQGKFEMEKRGNEKLRLPILNQKILLLYNHVTWAMVKEKRYTNPQLYTFRANRSVNKAKKKWLYSCMYCYFHKTATNFFTIKYVLQQHNIFRVTEFRVKTEANKSKIQTPYIQTSINWLKSFTFHFTCRVSP